MLLYENQFSEEYDLPLVNRPTKTLVIASTGRCGSHMLGHALHQTNSFGFPLEYLNPANLLEWKRRLGIRDTHEAVREIQRRRTSPNGVFGIKVHYPHLQMIGGFTGLKELLPDAQYIVLTRSNVLAQAVSLTIAGQTGVWIAGQPAVKKDPTYRYDDVAYNLRRIILDTASWRYTLAAHGCNRLEMDFESVRSDLSDSIRRIAEFVGVTLQAKDVPVDQATKKQGNSLNAEWVDRFLHDYRGDELLPRGTTDPRGSINRFLRRLLGK